MKSRHFLFLMLFVLGISNVNAQQHKELYDIFQEYESTKKKPVNGVVTYENHGKMLNTMDPEWYEYYDLPSSPEWSRKYTIHGNKVTFVDMKNIMRDQDFKHDNLTYAPIMPKYPYDCKANVTRRDSIILMYADGRQVYAGTMSYVCQHTPFALVPFNNKNPHQLRIVYRLCRAMHKITETYDFGAIAAAVGIEMKDLLYMLITGYAEIHIMHDDYYSPGGDFKYMTVRLAQAKGYGYESMLELYNAQIQSLKKEIDSKYERACNEMEQVNNLTDLSVESVNKAVAMLKDVSLVYHDVMDFYGNHVKIKNKSTDVTINKYLFSMTEHYFQMFSFVNRVYNTKLIDNNQHIIFVEDCLKNIQANFNCIKNEFAQWAENAYCDAYCLELSQGFMRRDNKFLAAHYHSLRWKNGYNSKGITEAYGKLYSECYYIKHLNGYELNFPNGPERKLGVKVVPFGTFYNIVKDEAEEKISRMTRTFQF